MSTNVYQLPKQAGVGLNSNTRTLLAPAAPWGVNDIIKLVVVVTMCLALLGVIYMALVGLVEPMIVVSFVLTTLTGIIAGAGISYVNGRSTETIRQESFALGKQTEKLEYQQALAANLAGRYPLGAARNEKM